MAERSSLRFSGFVFGGFSFVVTLIAFLVVREHVEGFFQLHDVAMAPTTCIHGHALAVSESDRGLHRNETCHSR